MKNTEKTMDKIVALCKNRGFIFAGSEIYGGLANTWDYGPLGVELKNNVKQAWWKKFITEEKYIIFQLKHTRAKSLDFMASLELDERNACNACSAFDILKIFIIFSTVKKSPSRSRGR